MLAACPPQKRLNTEGTEDRKKKWRDKPAVTKELMIEFLGVVFVPLGNLDDDVGGAVRNGLAAKPRFRRDSGSFVEFIEFGIGGFVARLQALPHDDVTRRASANAAAGVVEAHLETLGNVEDAAREAVMAVRDFFGVDLDRLAARKKRDLVFLCGGFVFNFFDVWIGAAHDLFSKRWRYKAAATIRGALSATTDHAAIYDSRHRLATRSGQVPLALLKTFRLRRACGL